MKKSYYQICENVGSSAYLHYSTLSNSFLVLTQSQHDLYESKSPEEVEKLSPTLFEKLCKNYFYLDDEIDELSQIFATRLQMVENTDLYHVVVNTTLDCNLDCWYCYENKIKGSKLTPEVISAIKLHIASKFEEQPYKYLKLSFFGGEPFMDFPAIKELLTFGKEFCAERNVELVADFTTNGVLISPERVDFLSQFRCHFQITLDGGRENHNKTKSSKNHSVDTYQKVLDTLRLIDERIEQRLVAVRINFDNKTLREIDEIINDISFLNRLNTYVILKKVWQVGTQEVDTDAMQEALYKLLDARFNTDYYVMPKGCVCFAERKNQVLFNYDGKVFKCTTISDFNEANSLGQFDLQTGQVKWDKSKTDNWYEDMQPDYCKQCKWFPVCLGICNRQLMAHKGERICTFDAFNLTEKEYLMYLFKLSILKKQNYEEYSK